MPARAVVVTIAFREPSHRVARLMAASLRATGWEGDIVALTDAAFDLPESLGVEQRVLPPSVINTDPEAEFQGAEIDCRDYPKPGDKGPPIKALTPLVHRWLDMERYDIALFLDADILALRNLHGAADEMARMRLPFGVGLGVGSLKGTTASNAHLSRLELWKWRRRPCINSGFFYFRPERAAMRILKAWEVQMARRLAGDSAAPGLYLRQMRDEADQAALQAVYLRRFSGEIELLPHDYQAFAPMPKRWDGRPESLPEPQSYLMHFRGAIRSPEIMFAYARRHVPGTLELLGDAGAG